MAGIGIPTAYLPSSSARCNRSRIKPIAVRFAW
jgi:hypothetical protein